MQVPRVAIQIRFNIIADDKELILSAHVPVLCLLLHMPLFIWLAFKYMKLQEHLQYRWVTEQNKVGYKGAK